MMGQAWERIFRLAAAMALAATTAACFQPVYAERPGTGGTVANQLSGITVEPVKFSPGSAERVANEVRNDMISALAPGGASAPTHRLQISVAANLTSIIVSQITRRPDVEISGLNATFNLIDNTTSQSVLTGTVAARVSYDIPGGEQRFARTRGLRDAENRAANEVADIIRTRVAAFLIAKAPRS